MRRGIYAVGRPEMTRAGELMAAVLAYGDQAVLSHRAAAEHWNPLAAKATPIDVTIPAERRTKQRGVRAHRRDLRPHDTTTHRNIPITAPPCTLVDLATVLTERELEAAVNAADKLDLVDPPTLRLAIRGMPPRAGKPALVGLLDRHTFSLTDSELERRFLPIARRPRPGSYGRGPDRSALHALAGPLRQLAREAHLASHR